MSPNPDLIRDMDSSSGFQPELWRIGGGARVATGTALAFASGLLVAAARGVAATGCARLGIACSALAAPFFALREVVASGTSMEGPVASTVSGGVAGGVGARILAGPSWTAVSRGSVFVGVGCGLANAAFLHLEKRYKLMLLRSVGQPSVRSYDQVEEVPSDGLDSMNSESSLPDHVKNKRLDLPSWLPTFGFDEEYIELIRRRESTIAAIEEERERIATLLDELELATAGARLQSDSGPEYSSA